MDKEFLIRKKNRVYSLIIPLFNRPDEIKELLQSVTEQSYKNFEVIVVEDGSTRKAEEIVKNFADRLPLRYYFKDNSGPGLARNYGCDRAEGDYFIFLDSDCLLPPHYLESVHNFLTTSYCDAFGGPDTAHPSFTPMQKAINYAMTSFFTTGGIRGRKNHIGVFHPRSFNMGISRAVYEQTRGFADMRFGEDVELSIRISKCGFTIGLIENAFVYHKRRTDLRKFFQQVHRSGIARINIYQRHPEALKAVHFFPSLFTTCGVALSIVMFFHQTLFLFSLAFLGIYTAIIIGDASRQNRSLTIGLLSAVASYVQLIGYGSGFIRALWKSLVLRRG
ncbi:MAG: glycosyltransferase [Deltaproteobacteria bacterium]|nr:glycosyltransferase [Deltaproteobacteria bacterium]